jgi:hypothetical protein
MNRIINFSTISLEQFEYSLPKEIEEHFVLNLLSILLLTLPACSFEKTHTEPSIQLSIKVSELTNSEFKEVGIGGNGSMKKGHFEKFTLHFQIFL